MDSGLDAPRQRMCLGGVLLRWTDLVVNDHHVYLIVGLKSDIKKDRSSTFYHDLIHFENRRQRKGVHSVMQFFFQVVQNDLAIDTWINGITSLYQLYPKAYFLHGHK
jgi:hypothetical protein